MRPYVHFTDMHGQTFLWVPATWWDQIKHWLQLDSLGIRYKPMRLE